MNWKKIILIIIPIALIAIVALQLNKNKKIAEERVYHYDREAPIKVYTDTLRLQEIGEDFTYTGNFAPNKASRISAEVQGKINEIFVDAGSEVKKGQALIQLDHSLLDYQLESINVKIEGLEADVKRFKVLAAADAIQGVQLEKAELGLKAARVQRQTLLEQIRKSTVRAPFDGVITAKMSDEGAFAAPGMPLLQIMDISTLKFTIYVPQRELLKFNIGESYPVRADIYPDKLLHGTAIMVGSGANMASSFPIQFEVQNLPGNTIKSGMFGNLILQKHLGEKGLLVPASAIQGSTANPMLYLVDQGKAVLRKIKIGKRFDNRVVVTEGVQEGDVIIVKGFINLFEGANVQSN